MTETAAAAATPPLPRRGMSKATARTVEYGIIGLCLAALVMIFQPFSKQLSAWGMGLVVLGGLAFNLVPFCEPGRPARDLARTAIIVAIVFVAILALALGSAELYAIYLKGQRPGG